MDRTELEQIPTEKLADLLGKMMNDKQALLSIIDLCRQPRLAVEIDEMVLLLQAHKRSVYTPVTLRGLLQDSCALVYVEPEIESSASAGSASVNDGEGDLVVIRRPEGSWVATPTAIAYLDALNPVGELQALVEEDLDYKDIYLNVLNYCSEKGRTAEEIAAIVDDDPIVQEPRRFSGYFVQRLEQADALLWDGAWKTTTVGASLLTMSRDENWG